MKVLLVDDNARIRRMFRSILESTVQEFIECSDGFEALEAYATHRPDWVLMDVEMTKVDGITATRQIIGAFPDARIIMVTNKRDSTIQESARAAGAMEYVLKEDIHRVLELIEG